MNISTEKNLEALSLEYISRQAVGSLLLLLMSAMEDAELGVTALPYEIPQELQEIKDAVHAYLLRLEDLLEDDAEQCGAALEDCLAWKQRLLELYRPISSYFFHCNVLSTAVSDQLAQRKYVEEALPMDKIDWNLFLEDCHRFLESAADDVQQADYVRQFLRCIPLYITRESYLDAVGSALRLGFTGDSKEEIAFFLRICEDFCCTDAIAAQDHCFPELTKWIAEALTISPASLSEEALQELEGQINDTMDALAQIEEYFSCILHDLNSLILLFCLSYSFGELTQEDVSYADLYHTVCAFISGELTLTEQAAYLDSLKEQLDAAVEPVIDRANALSTEEQQLLQQIDSIESLSEDTQKILMTEQFIRSCFYNDLEAELLRPDLPAELPPATAAERDALIRPFLAKARASFDALPTAIRRLTMQHFSATLPPMYSAHEALDFLKNALEKCSSDAQRAVLVDKISVVFLENNYRSLVELQEEEDELEELLHRHDCGCGHHHHHHHDHDCGCGHDHHHHDHDCGCGHDHHHH